jgi:hypothetical protein
MGCENTTTESMNDLQSPPLTDGGTGDAHTGGPATRCTPLGSAKLISTLPGAHYGPRIGYTGSGFVVGWNTELDRTGPRNRIDLALTAPDGTHLGPNLPLTDQPVADPGGPSLSPLVGGTMVAWTRLTQSGANMASDIVLSAIDPNGQRIGADGNLCDPSDSSCGLFPLTSSGTAWEPELSRPQVDSSNGGPIDHQVSLAFVDARNYACSSVPCTTPNDIYWKRVQVNGTVVVPDERITQPATSAFHGYPRLAFDGVHEGLVFSTFSSATQAMFSFVVLNSAGTVNSGPDAVGMASGQLVSAGAPALVWDGQDYGLTTATGSDAQASVVFQRFLSNGVASFSPVGVTYGGVACTPRVAWDGQYFAVVWQTECGKPGSDIAFELLDKSGFRVRADGTSCGNSVDPACGVTLLTTKESTLINAKPDIAWAGAHSFGVVWSTTDVSGEALDAAAAANSSEIYIQRIDCVSP